MFKYWAPCSTAGGVQSSRVFVLAKQRPARDRGRAIRVECAPRLLSLRPPLPLIRHTRAATASPSCIINVLVETTVSLNLSE